MNNDDTMNSSDISSKKAPSTYAYPNNPHQLLIDGKAIKKCTDHNSLGVSPTYWSHIPLMVSDVLSLALLNGVLCYVVSLVPPSSNQSEIDENHSEFIYHPEISIYSSSSQGNNQTTLTQPPYHIVPVTNCELVGVVVYVKISSTYNSYIVDDGSGIVDCRIWKEENHPDNLLLPTAYSENRIRVGDLARVLGRIQCIATETKVTQPSNSNNMNNTSNTSMTTKTKFSTKEVRASSIEKLEDDRNINSNKVDRDSETLHWLRCIQFRKRMANTLLSLIDDENAKGKNKRNISVDNDEAVSSTYVKDIGDFLIMDEQTLKNSEEYSENDVIEIINDGKNPDANDNIIPSSKSILDAIYKPIVEKDDTSSDDDCIEVKTNNYNNFSILRTTTNMTLKDKFQMTIKILSAVTRIKKRQILRSTLPTLWHPMAPCECYEQYYTQKAVTKNSSLQSTNKRRNIKESLLYCHCVATKDESMDPENTFRDALLLLLLQMEEDANSTTNNHDQDLRFSFTYKQIMENKNLEDVALKTMVNSGALSGSASFMKFLIKTNKQRLYRSTFHKLNKDGIIYLRNQSKDEYILLSRQYVLEPYCLSCILQNKNSKEDEGNTKQVQVQSNMADSTTLSLSRNVQQQQQPKIKKPYVDHVPMQKLKWMEMILEWENQ